MTKPWKAVQCESESHGFTSLPSGFVEIQPHYIIFILSWNTAVHFEQHVPVKQIS